MKQYNAKITIQPSRERLRFVDITDKIKEIVKESEIQYGAITIYTTHTTCAVRINENEQRLIDDFKNFLEELAPSYKHYRHDDIQERDCPPDERINGHSHCKALLLGASETIPILDYQLKLGSWQSIFHIDLDGVYRERSIEVYIMGE
jgi:secondary thiamine-phosphate synthase enzyme